MQIFREKSDKKDCLIDMVVSDGAPDILSDHDFD